MSSPSDDLPYVFDLLWDLKTKDDLLKALESPACDPDMITYASNYGYISQEYQGTDLTPSEKAVLLKLRTRGFAVAVFNPKELGAEDRTKVEESMVSHAIYAFGVSCEQDEDNEKVS
ncbi:MAG TPA: hypothetical protein VFM18_07725 [Methanosarcina sp.]|nr:hypothetical protein [Methanosarcina sp.]